jgi:hypothetical protein
MSEKTVSTKIDVRDWLRLRITAAARGITVAEQLRRWIDGGLQIDPHPLLANRPDLVPPKRKPKLRLIQGGNVVELRRKAEPAQAELWDDRRAK